MMCFWMAGTFSGGSFDAEIAAGDHDAVGGLQNAVKMLDGLGLFELGDDPGFAAVGGDAIAHQANIFSGADEGDGDGVDAVFEGELEVGRVFFGERGNANRNAGEVDALVFAEHAAIDDFADDVVADALHGRAVR